MGLGDVVSYAAAIAGAWYGAVEGVVHLGGEVSKLSGQELLYGKKPKAGASESATEPPKTPKTDKAVTSEAEAPKTPEADKEEPKAPQASSAERCPRGPAAKAKSPGGNCPAEVPPHPDSPVKAATVKIDAWARENQSMNRVHAPKDYNISRGYKLPVKPAENAAKPASRLQHCRTAQNQDTAFKKWAHP